MRPVVSSSLCTLAGGVKSAAMIAAMAASAAMLARQCGGRCGSSAALSVGGRRGLGSAQLGGGVACPTLLLPQHVISPFSRIAQVYEPPALTAIKRPAGASPGLYGYGFSPQHAISPFSRIAQLWPMPALTAIKLPSGASVYPN